MRQAPLEPAHLVRRAQGGSPPPRALRDQEEVRLRRVLEKATGFEARRDRALIELLLTSGIRIGSAIALDIEDLDLRDGFAELREMKGGRGMTVQIPKETRTLLADYLGDRMTGPVFADKNGRRLSARHVQRRFRQCRERAGIPARASLHSLRHRFAQRLYGETRDLLAVRRALGHRSITSTMVYAELATAR